MKKAVFLALVLFHGLTTQVQAEKSLVETLLAGYEKVKTLSCEVRKKVVTPSDNVTFLSRVYYEREDKLHVQNISPLKRRIISNGKRLYNYMEGSPRGFSRPVAELDEKMTISLRKVPGTAMDHLMRLKGINEKILPDSREGFKRRGYKAENHFVVLSMNDHKHLVLIQFFASDKMEEVTAFCKYSNFQEILKDVWIPRLHKVEATLAGLKSRETVRITNLVVNEPIAESLFIAEQFFENVEFVDDFADIVGD